MKESERERLCPVLKAKYEKMAYMAIISLILVVVFGTITIIFSLTNMETIAITTMMLITAQTGLLGVVFTIERNKRQQEFWDARCI